MHSGAGLVTLGVPKGIAKAVIKKKIKEVMLLALPETIEGSLSSKALAQIREFTKKIDVVVIGPGLGREASTWSLVRRIVERIKKPMVVDADGLNALAGHLKSVRNLIMTPHPGEMARLSGVSVREIQGDRRAIARKFSREHHLTLILKGHRTIVADYRGNLYINKTGNPGMSTAGSGDVLSGMVAAFLGQGLDAYKAAKYAVYLHGLAGDLAVREKTEISLIASDIIGKIPEAIRKSS